MWVSGMEGIWVNTGRSPHTGFSFWMTEQVAWLIQNLLEVLKVLSKVDMSPTVAAYLVGNMDA